MKNYEGRSLLKKYVFTGNPFFNSFIILNGFKFYKNLILGSLTLVALIINS
jgi:hypothetical protein